VYVQWLGHQTCDQQVASSNSLLCTTS